jgi:hypothetical protein
VEQKNFKKHQIPFTTSAHYVQKAIHFSVDISPKFWPLSNLHWQNSIELTASFLLAANSSLVDVLFFLFN